MSTLDAWGKYVDWLRNKIKTGEIEMDCDLYFYTIEDGTIFFGRGDLLPIPNEMIEWQLANL